jgi:hypothetical protein
VEGVLLVMGHLLFWKGSKDYYGRAPEAALPFCFNDGVLMRRGKAGTKTTTKANTGILHCVQDDN